MTNPALKDMVEIGYAKDVEQRRQQLSTTALPYEYEVYATYETSGNLEDKKLHKMIDNPHNIWNVPSYRFPCLRERRNGTGESRHNK